MSITLVQKNKSKGILTWYARVPDPKTKGKTHFFSLGTTSKSEAKLIMQQRLKEGAYDIKDEAETMTLGEAAVKFEQYERAKGVKPGSDSGYFFLQKVDKKVHTHFTAVEIIGFRQNNTIY